MIRKKARLRRPEEPVVATFMVAYDKWQAFKTVLEAEGTTISAALVAFIDGYLAAMQSPDLTSQEINQRLQYLLRHKTDHWEQQVATLRHRVLRTEAGLEQLNFAIELLQRERAARPVELEVMPVTPSDAPPFDLTSIDPSTSDPAPLDPNDVLPNEIQIHETRHHPHSASNAEAAGFTVEPSAAPATFAPAGLNLAALCRAFGIKPQNLDRQANLRGMTLENYLYLLTGWSYRQGRYYPPS
ncbi:MAG: hypothetical protein ACPGVO_19310 [Spirulinaceae cyanobacterium]